MEKIRKEFPEIDESKFYKLDYLAKQMQVSTRTLIREGERGLLSITWAGKRSPRIQGKNLLKYLSKVSNFD
jgi:hypothetical protein